jgi:hypothetical protein
MPDMSLSTPTLTTPPESSACAAQLDIAAAVQSVAANNVLYIDRSSPGHDCSNASPFIDGLTTINILHMQ